MTNKADATLKEVELHKQYEEVRQIAYDAIDFLRVLEEDGEFRHWREGYNKQVLEELRQDAKKMGLI